MPLVLVCGLPGAGKALLAAALYRHFAPARAVKIVDLRFSPAEPRTALAELKSAAASRLARGALVVVSATGHMKSLRYELFALAKSMADAFVVVEVRSASAAEARTRFVSEYCGAARPARYVGVAGDDVFFVLGAEGAAPTEADFDALARSFERPDAACRWDRAYVCVDDAARFADFERVGALLAGRLGKNRATVRSVPLAREANYLAGVKGAIDEVLGEAAALGVRERREAEDAFVRVNSLRPVELGKVRGAFARFLGPHK